MVHGSAALAACVLLCLVTVTRQSGAQPTNAAANEQDAAQVAAAHVTWRMEATAQVASLAIRNMYCKLEPERLCESLPLPKLWPLQRWAMTDAAWGRLLASLSNYELGRRFWQQQDYQRSLEVVEWSIAYKLFPYEDNTELQSHWQQNLMGTSPSFKRPKLELADGLILMANCMYEIGRRQSSVEHLYLSLEAIHLSATLMHNSLDLVQEVLSHLELLSQHVALALTQSLSRIKSSKLMELMVVYGAQCQSCVERRDFVEALLARLSLPVRYEPGGAGTALEVTHPTFVHDAYVRQAGEGQEQFTRRLMQQLVGMVRLGLLSDLNVPCTKWSDERDCESHMPGWMYSINKTGSDASSRSSDNASSSNSSSSSSIPAASGGSNLLGSSEQQVGSTSRALDPGTWAGASEPPRSPDSTVLIDALYTGDMRQDMRRLRWTFNLLLGHQAEQHDAAHAAAQDDVAGSGTGWASAAAAWGMAQEALDPADLGQLDWQAVPPFPPPPTLMPGPQYKALGLMPPLPFKPPKPTPGRPPSYKRIADVAVQARFAEHERSAPLNTPATAHAGAPPPTQHGATPPSAASQQQAQSSSCCNPHQGVVACCGPLERSPGSSSSSSSSSSSGGLASWLHRHGVWASTHVAVAPAAGPLSPEQQLVATTDYTLHVDWPVLLFVSGLSTAAILSYRHRRRVRSWTSQLIGRMSVQTVVPPMPCSTQRFSAPRVEAQGCPPGMNPAAVGSDAPLAAQRRKAAAAALKETLTAVSMPALPGSSVRPAVARLEAAIQAAEAAGLQDAALMQRADAALAELRRRLQSSCGAVISGSVTSSSHVARQRSRGRSVTAAASAAATEARVQSAAPGASPATDQQSGQGASGAPASAVGRLGARLRGLLACWGRSGSPSVAGSESADASQHGPAAGAGIVQDASQHNAPSRPAAARSSTLSASPAALGRAATKLQPGLILSRPSGPGLAEAADTGADPGSPQSTSTGSSFAERVSHNNVGLISHSSKGQLPAAAPTPPAPLLPAYTEYALYDWEALPPEVTADVGWQEGHKKRGKTGTATNPEAPPPPPQPAPVPATLQGVSPVTAATPKLAGAAAQLTSALPAKAVPQLSSPAAASSAPPASIAVPASIATAAANNKPQAAPSQLQPGTDAILTRAKPVKTKLGPVGSKGAALSSTPGQTIAGANVPPSFAKAARAALGTPSSAASPGPSPASSTSAWQRPARAQGNHPHLTNSQSFSPSPNRANAASATLPTLSSLSLSPTCMSPSIAGPAARRSPEQLAALYGYPPPPPPPPPRSSPAQSNPAFGGGSGFTTSPVASPLKASTPPAPPAPRHPAAQSTGNPSSPGNAPGEPNPFAQPAAAMLAATTTELPPSHHRATTTAASASKLQASAPSFFSQNDTQPSTQRQVSSAKAFASSPLNPFGGKPLGNGALGLQLGSFHSADYESLSLLDGRNVSRDFDKVLGEPGNPASPRVMLQQQQYGQFKGVSAGGAFTDATDGGGYAQNLPDSTTAASLSPLLFSSSVWSNTAVGAADTNGSWIAHSASVPLIEARTSSGGSMGSAASGGPAAAPAAAAGAQGGGWLSHLGTTPAPATSPSTMSASLWSTATATLFGGSSGSTWGAARGGVTLGNPAPTTSSLTAGGLPQIPSESDLVRLGVVSYEPEADGLLGTSPDLKATEAPDWAHQIMRVVE